MSEARKPTRRVTKADGKSKRTGTRRSNATAPTDGPMQAPPEKCFWVNHGPVLNDLRGLHDALNAVISDEQFAYHVSGEKNDFATWVADVFGDEQCAAALRRARTRAAAARVIARSLPRAT